MKEWTEQHLNEKLETGEPVCVFFYTPLCGTCQMAKKMLSVVTELLPQVEVGMCNLNYMPEKAVNWSIESVPCLLIIQNRAIINRIYAFRSVVYVHEMLKNST